MAAEKNKQQATEAFARLVEPGIEEEHIELARAALTIARTEYPHLDIASYLGKLDELGARVRARMHSDQRASNMIEAVNSVLFEQEGFQGNSADYYDPRNSFLNDVMDRHTGIPITLSLVYMEVSRRAGLPLLGVGMPGHFLLKHYEADGQEILIDPFERGRILSHGDCQQRLDEIYGGHMPLRPEFLASVSPRLILTRMLNNLRTIYLNNRRFRNAVAVFDLLLTIYPRSPEDIKDRAQLRYSVGQLRGAIQDLEEYLRIVPEAPDGESVRQTMLSLRQSMASRN